VLISIMLAGLTGFLVHRKKYGWAAFTFMLFIFALWSGIAALLAPARFNF